MLAELASGQSKPRCVWPFARAPVPVTLLSECNSKSVHLAAGAFDDPDVIHVEDSVDPVRDLDIIHNELRLKVGNSVMRYSGAQYCAWQHRAKHYSRAQFIMVRLYHNELFTV